MALPAVHAARGFVSTVGAGPGDPDLLTVKALKRLKRAEVVAYDRLVNPEIPKVCSAEARLLYVGKYGPCGTSWSQEAINTLLVQEASTGNTVVRVKGGATRSWSDAAAKRRSRSRKQGFRSRSSPVSAPPSPRPLTQAFPSHIVASPPPPLSSRGMKTPRRTTRAANGRGDTRHASRGGACGKAAGPDALVIGEVVRCVKASPGS